MRSCCCNYREVVSYGDDMVCLPPSEAWVVEFLPRVARQNSSSEGRLGGLGIKRATPPAAKSNRPTKSFFFVPPFFIVSAGCGAACSFCARPERYRVACSARILGSPAHRCPPSRTRSGFSRFSLRTRYGRRMVACNLCMGSCRSSLVTFEGRTRRRTRAWLGWRSDATLSVTVEESLGLIPACMWWMTTSVARELHVVVHRRPARWT